MLFWFYQITKPLARFNLVRGYFFTKSLATKWSEKLKAKNEKFCNPSFFVALRNHLTMQQ